MKKWVFMCLSAIFTMSGLFAQQQYTVAVTPFDLIGGFTRADADVLEILFFTELGRSSGIKVVDRDSFERISTQQKFQTSDWSDTNKVAELGKALNANAIIRGQLMSLAGKFIITVRIVDVNTTEVLSAAPLQLSGLDEIFGIMPNFVADVIKELPKLQAVYKIGDKGPGGGIIFFAEGNQYMECSGELGRATWSEAETAARNFRGGGFTDWHLPTLAELDLMYQNLKRKDMGGFNNDRYWSSSESSENTTFAWFQNFRDGNQTVYGYTKESSFCVRAVRAF